MYKPLYERPRFMRGPRPMRGGKLTLEQLILLGRTPPGTFFQRGRGIKRGRGRSRRTRRRTRRR